MIEHFDLTGRAALVVGAENPAGEAVAAAYNEAGAAVTLVSADIDDVAAAIEAMPSIDLLATAADAFLAKPVIETTDDDLQYVMAVNFELPFKAIQLALPKLREPEFANITLVTTVLGERGLPNTSAYSAAHGAVYNMVRALAQELAPEAISINGIELGWMDWMTDRINPKDPEAQRAVRFTLSKRLGEADDIGPLAVWLAGSGVGFVTGQFFPLDGGLTQHL